jgi:hypothetical protein
MNRFRKHREILGNRYATIRDSIQKQRPFVIINFLTEGVYMNFLNELDSFGKIQYILQDIYHGRKKYPSVFLTNEGTDISVDEFREIVKQIMKNHHIDSVMALYEGKVGVVYRDGKGHVIGESIYSTLDPSEIRGDKYHLDGKFYTFI